MKDVLIATTGMSPAVLTETVWALAHPAGRAAELYGPVLPDEVKVVTTVSGKRRLMERLLQSGVWKELRAALGAESGKLRFHEDCIRVVHDANGEALDGLNGPEDHAAFADAVMHELWAYSARPDVRITASLAGGYKTMSALMLTSMQLLARPGDRITHVLVSGGLDAPDRGFFFPKTPEEAENLHLIEIPLIPLRKWFRDLHRKEPPSYEELVEGSAKAVEKRLDSLRLEISAPSENPLWMSLNSGERIPLTPCNYAYLACFVQRKIENVPPAAPPGAYISDFIAKLYRKSEVVFGRLYDKSGDISTQTVSRRLSELRSFLRSLGPEGCALANALPMNGRWELAIPLERIRIRRAKDARRPDASSRSD